MFTPTSARAEKNFAVTPGWDRMPTPTTETLPIRSSYSTSLKPISSLRPSSVAMAARPSVLGKVKEMSVREVADADTFCTIMSMLISVAATASKIRAAWPTRSGTPTIVIFASIMGDAGDDGLLHHGSFLEFGHPGPVLVRERRPYVHPDVLPACVLHAAQMQHLGPACRHLEHLLVTDVRDASSAGHDPRVGGVNAIDVGIDLAMVGAEGRRQRNRRRVRSAAAKRGHVLRVLRNPLEACDDDDVSLI